MSKFGIRKLFELTIIQFDLKFTQEFFTWSTKKYKFLFVNFVVKVQAVLSSLFLVLKNINLAKIQ